MSSSSIQSKPTTTTNKIFSLLVTLQFTSEEYKQQFLLDIAPVVTHVKTEEGQTTLSYEILQSDQESNKILILERYIDKENAYLQIHKSSQRFLEFRPKLQSMQQKGYVTIQGESFVDVQY